MERETGQDDLGSRGRHRCGERNGRRSARIADITALPEFVEIAEWGKLSGLDKSDAFEARLQIARAMRNRRNIVKKMLSRDFIIFAVVPRARPGDRKVLKFSYDRPLQLVVDRPGARVWRRCKDWRRFLHTRMKLKLSASNAAYCRSYHFQLITPGDVAITQATLYDADAEDSSCTVFQQTEKTASTRCELFSYGPNSIPMGIKGNVLVEFAPIRRVWMGASLVLSLIVTMVLLSPLVHALTTGGDIDQPPKILNNSASNVMGLVVTLIALVLTVIMNPEENTFSRHALAHVRVLSMASVAVVAFSLIIGAERAAYSRTWLAALAVVPLLAAVFQAVALMRSVRPLKTATADGVGGEVQPERKLGREILKGVVYRQVRDSSRPMDEEHADLKNKDVQDVVEALLADGRDPRERPTSMCWRR
jgi:hypothetical protein